VVAEDLGDVVDPDPPADTRLLDQELGVALRDAFAGLPGDCQSLLRLCTAVPRLSYREIGDRLAMPHGSIGPTRQRCLDRLRNMAPLRSFREDPFPDGTQP
jgi:DNA-directed RNA polymerase specialized sigma24 family protein